MSFTIVIAVGAVIFLIAIALPCFELLRYWLRRRRRLANEDRRSKRKEKIDKEWRESLAAKHAKTEQIQVGKDLPPRA